MTSLQTSTWRKNWSRWNTLRHEIALQMQLGRSTTRESWSILRISRHWYGAEDDDTDDVRIQRGQDLSVERRVETVSYETTVRRYPFLLTEVRADAALSFRHCLTWKHSALNWGGGGKHVFIWFQVSARRKRQSCHPSLKSISSFNMFIYIYQSVSIRLLLASKHKFDQTHFR